VLLPPQAAVSRARDAAHSGNKKSAAPRDRDAPPSRIGAQHTHTHTHMRVRGGGEKDQRDVGEPPQLLSAYTMPCVLLIAIV